MTIEVSAIIPTIPPRKDLLRRAVASVNAQTVSGIEIVTAVDTGREGSAKTRNRAMMKANGQWYAFLDDDDYWLPNHVETLWNTAVGGPYDVVYSGCRVIGADGRVIPLQEEWGRFGQDFDPDLLRQKSYIPVTSMVRSDLAIMAGFGPPKGVDTPYDDWGFYLRLLEMGAVFKHVPEVTWVWDHGTGNTSGQPTRW